MKFDIRAFVATPGRRLPVDFRVTPSAELLADSDWSLDEIHVIGDAFAQLSTLYLEVELRARITQPCGRCLEPVAVSLVIDEPFEVPISPDSDWVDLLPTAIQMIQTIHNPHVLCSKACRGLCPTCGANLNEDPDHDCKKTDSERHTLRDFVS
jgi:uncharacterized metal-binding protein YceD (DUF177 family)